MMITDQNDPSQRATFYFHEGTLYIRTTNGEQVEISAMSEGRTVLMTVDKEILKKAINEVLKE